MSSAEGCLLKLVVKLMCNGPVVKVVDLYLSLGQLHTEIWIWKTRIYKTSQCMSAQIRGPLTGLSCECLKPCTRIWRSVRKVLTQEWDKVRPKFGLALPRLRRRIFGLVTFHPCESVETDFQGQVLPASGRHALCCDWNLENHRVLTY